MNNPLDPTLRELNDCGCCAGTAVETAVAIDNRPGLGAISFRAGKHSQFKATMLALLSAADSPALRNLKTRDDDDFTIALLDGWATVADVLTFYSERIANESFLRSATELRSIVDLARSIGYELNPGVAASTWLAFTVDESLGAPGYANIDKGTKMQSIPGPDETPQVFETLEGLYADKTWNSTSVKSSDFITPYLGMTKIYLEGTTTNLNPGDALLIVGDERKRKKNSENWDFRRVKDLETFPNTDADEAYTVVTLDRGVGSRIPHVDPAQKNPKVYALRQRAALFGANAADWNLLPLEVRTKVGDSANTTIEWPHLTISEVSGSDTVHLDAVYSGIVVGGWVVLSSPEYQELYRVAAVAEDSPAKFGLSSKSTKLTVTGENLKDKFDTKIRETVVFGQSEELSWAKAPFYEAVFGDEITLAQTVSELPADRALLVSGLRARVKVTAKGASLELTLADGTTLPLIIGDVLTLTGPPVVQAGTSETPRWELEADDGSTGFLLATAEKLEFVAADASSARVFERATLKRTEITSDGLARLVLTAPLTYAYDPTTTLVYANVAYATHGETTSEVLGSGDATQAHQRFVLKQTPLTYTPAANPTGGETTLEIWVNEVKWTEAETLYNRGPSERIYVVRLDDEGIVTVLFGDGEIGARLPTGQENVRAVYRKGTGHEGLLKADQLSLLMTRPLGVKAVTNPKATEGAADPQELADARSNAPTTVLTLDRVVSLQDYEDFARNFSGVGKALATWTWNAHSRGLFLTVAGVAGAAISADSSTRTDLLESLLELGNPLVPIEIESYTPISFKLAGTVYVDADRVAEDVGTAVNDALKAAFSFDARSFGQPVTLSEVEAVIQNVDGVAFIDLDALYIGTTSKLEDYLPAQMPIDGAAADLVSPAELLTLDETSLSALEVKTA